MDMHVDYFAGEHLYHDSRTCYGIWVVSQFESYSFNLVMVSEA